MWIELLEINTHRLLSSLLHQATNLPAFPETTNKQTNKPKVQLISNSESWCDHPNGELQAAVADWHLLSRFLHHQCPSQGIRCDFVSYE